MSARSGPPKVFGYEVHQARRRGCVRRHRFRAGRVLARRPAGRAQVRAAGARSQCMSAVAETAAEVVTIAAARARLAAVDWAEVAAALDSPGVAVCPGLLRPQECAA